MPVQSEVVIEEAESVGNVTTKIRRGGPEVIEEMAVPWCNLWDQASEDPFYRPEWVLTYLRSFVSKPAVWLVTAFLGERLIAVLPLVKEVGLFRGLPVRQLRGAACIHSCRFDLLRAPGALGVAATNAIWKALEQTSGWDLIQIPYTPADGNAIDLLQNAEQAGFPTAADVGPRSRYMNIAGEDGIPKIDPPLCADFRSHLRRWARRLEQATGSRAKLMTVTAADPDMLQKFFELEASGWKGRNGTAIASRPDTKMFYDEAARIGANLGCFRLSLLQANGRLIAAAFGMAIGRTYLPLKAAYDETLSHCSPGHLLIETLLESCLAEGITKFEFGGDDEHYKRLWTPLTRDYQRVYIFHPRKYGRLLRFHKRVVVPRIKHILSQVGKVFRSEAKTKKQR